MNKKSKKHDSISYRDEFDEDGFEQFVLALSSWLLDAPSPLDETLGKESFKKVKIAFKRDGDAVLMEMKVRRRQPVDVQSLDVQSLDAQSLDAQALDAQLLDAMPVNNGEKSAPPSGTAVSIGDYKHLKKKMKDSYRLLKTAQAAGELPEEAVITLFLSQSEQMVTYPDKGEPLYARYIDACHQLKAAYYQKDQAAFNVAMGNMDELKKQAHHTYK